MNYFCKYIKLLFPNYGIIFIMKNLNKYLSFHLFCFVGYFLTYYFLVVPLLDEIIIPLIQNHKPDVYYYYFYTYFFLNVIYEIYILCKLVLYFIIAFFTEKFTRFLLKKFANIEWEINFDNCKIYKIIRKFGIFFVFMPYIFTFSYYFVAISADYFIDISNRNAIENSNLTFYHYSYVFLFTHVLATKLFKNPNDNWS